MYNLRTLERFAPFIAAAVAASILLGCGFGQEATSSPESDTVACSNTADPGAPNMDIAAGNGLLEGRVTRSGVDPRSGAGGTGATAPVSGDPIEIRGSDGTVVAQAVSAEDGTFQVTLPVAVYTVTEDILGINQCAEVVDQGVTTITFELS